MSLQGYACISPADIQAQQERQALAEQMAKAKAVLNVAAPRGIPMVPEHMESLAVMQEDLHRTVCELVERLDPVIRPAEPDCEGANIEKPAYSVPLVEQIERQIARTAGTLRVVRSLLDRLEI